MKKICICLTALCILLMYAVPAFPDAEKIRTTLSEADKGSLIITYHNLSGSEDPVCGAEFEVEQTASLSVFVTEDGEAGLTRESLIFDENGNPVVIGSETDASEIEKTVKNARKNGRAKGYHTMLTTDAEGKARAEGLPPGIYLVRETRPAPGYLLSKAFLVSIPQTSSDGTSGWKLEVEVFPKPEKMPAEPSPAASSGSVRTGDRHAPLWLPALGMVLTGVLAIWACLAGRRMR